MFYSDYYGWTEHGFLKFGLSSLPDTCVILSAELWYFDLGDLSPPLLTTWISDSSETQRFPSRS